MRIEGAQLVESNLPAAAGGPAITLLSLPSRRVTPGFAGYAVSGRAAQGSFAIHVALEGDDGHWVLPVGLPDDVYPNERHWDAILSFSAKLPAGDTAVSVVATDREGRAGELVQSTLTAAVATSTAPLQVTLSWNVQADVDLHVVTPDGIDISAKNPNAYAPPKPGEPPAPPDAWRLGARLDLDSNAGCVIDGVRRERIEWPLAPAPGPYAVYVDLFSGCGTTATSFRVEVSLNGETLRQASGTLYEFDARTHPLGPGAPPGALVTSFEIP